MTEPDVRRLDTTSAFVVTDLPHAETSDGITRCARKVLIDSTKALARSRTYAWALLGERIGGASAAINAEGDERGAAIEAFCTELSADVQSGTLTLAAGKGVDPGELAGLGNVVEPDHEAFIAGLVAAATAALGTLDGTTVAVESDGGAGESLSAALTRAGAQVVAQGADAFAAEADVLMFGSKAGVLDHERAALLPHRLLVPTGALAFTPRALAVASRREITVLADFLTTAGPLVKRSGGDPASTLGELTAKVLGHDQGPVLGACLIAEEFLTTWCDELPFGRPIG